MTEREALDTVKYSTDVRFSLHAIQRMVIRGAQREDVFAALRSATAATEQDNGNWKIKGGADLDGDDLDVIVAFEGDVVIVTIF